MYAPHTVTVYNSHEDLNSLENVYNVTVLEGVFLDISKGANVMQSGLENVDSARMFIPFSIEAINGKTGQAQTYVEPKEYERLDDKSSAWTIRAGGSSSAKDCFFVKGKIVSDEGFQEINARYDHVFRVSSVDLRDFGSESMQHWEVNGK